MGDAAKALRDAAKQLEKKSETARLDAELLLAYALGITREKLLLDLPSLDSPATFVDLTARREQCEPVAHIIGTKEFWGLSFNVNSNVLIPRPDSELLIETAENLFDSAAPIRILDLGTGSGALLLAALSQYPNASGVGIDVSAPALSVAHGNADHLGLSARADFLLLDWTVPGWSDDLDGPFNIILANPPYIANATELSRDVRDYEPHQALFAGKDGLDDYRIIFPALAQLLKAGGAALVEIGFDQEDAVTWLANQAGYNTVCKRDLGGHSRMIMLTKNAV